MGTAEPVRLPELAGSWYPAREQEVRAEIERFRSLTHPVTDAAGPVLGGIVPHAGWTFSGRLAYDVLHAMAQGPTPDVVVVFGKHMGPHGRPTLMRRGRWRTPLGDLPISSALADAIVGRFDFEEETAERYEPDNTIELQLPFIKALFPAAAIVPIGVPARAESMRIGEAVAEAALENGLTVRIVGSTDLTHYGPNYRFSPKGSGAQAERWVREHNDREVVDRLVGMQPEQALEHATERRSACCVGAAIAAVAAVRSLGGSQGRLLDYATSNDVRPGGASFVGYAAIVYH